VLKIIWRIFFIFLCEYLFIEWFPITYPFTISDILVGPIIYPLEFMAALFALFFGLVCSVQLLQQIYKLTKKGVKKKRSKH
jgi:polyferredoxin